VARSRSSSAWWADPAGRPAAAYTTGGGALGPHGSGMPGTVSHPHGDELFSREIEAIPENVGPLRRAFAAALDAAGVGEPRRGEIALAVSEACTNAVVHAYVGGPPGTVALWASRVRDGVEVVVRDRGSGMHPRPDSPGLGLGLPLIGHLAEGLEIVAAPGGAGTEVRMQFAV
jgi:serine/threonine-protein kinase RsbW